MVPYMEEVYQSRVQSTMYTHVMVPCNTVFVLHTNILLMQPFRVSSVDVGRLAEPRNPRVLLCSILYASASASISILAYSTWCTNVSSLEERFGTLILKDLRECILIYDNFTKYRHHSSSDGINKGGKASTICDNPTKSNASKETVYPEIIQEIYEMNRSHKPYNHSVNLCLKHIRIMSCQIVKIEIFTLYQS